MDFFSSSKGKKEGKRSRFFGKKTSSASTPQSPVHPAGGRSPPPGYFSNKRAESEYAFNSSEERAGYVLKQPASERVPPASSGYAFRPSDERAEYVLKHPASERVPAVSSGYNFRASEERAEYVLKHPASERVPAVSSGYAYRSNDEENNGYMWKQPDSARVAGGSSGYAFRSSDEENDGYVLKMPASERVPATSSRYAFQSPDDEQCGGYVWRQPASERVPTPSGYAFRPTENENAGYVRRQLPPVRVQASHGKPPIFASHTPDRRSNHGKEKVEEEYEDPRAYRPPRHSTTPSPKREVESRSPPPAYYSNEKTESENSDDNFSFIEDQDQDQSAYMFPEIANPSRPVSGNSTPVHYTFETQKAIEDGEKEFEPPELPDESQSFSLSEIAKMRGMKSYEKEEIQSVISELYVPVGNYRVRASVSSTLQSILDKYGDIASGSKLQSLSTRSYYLDSLSSVVLELKSTLLKDLTVIRVKEIMAVVKDVEAVKIDVSWLTQILEELLEAVECYGQHEAAQAEKETCERDLETTKKEVDEQMKELNLKQKEIKEFREKVTECGAKVGQLEIRGARLKKDLVFLKSKVEKFVGETVMV